MSKIAFFGIPAHGHTNPKPWEQVLLRIVWPLGTGPNDYWGRRDW